MLTSNLLSLPVPVADWLNWLPYWLSLSEDVTVSVTLSVSDWVWLSDWVFKCGSHSDTEWVTDWLMDSECVSLCLCVPVDSID